MLTPVCHSLKIPHALFAYRYHYNSDLNFLQVPLNATTRLPTGTTKTHTV